MRLTLVNTVDSSYSIDFGIDMFPQIAADLKRERLGSKYAVITDSNVEPLYGGKFMEALDAEGVRGDLFVFDAGEENKNLRTVEYLAGRMTRAGYNRGCAVIALGGGVVGDTAGFTASIHYRGIQCCQVPTTFLSQADSSIGGKTGVDTDDGKNLVGRIEQPKHVWIDVGTLRTMDERDYRSGLAETVKHGVIANREFFDYVCDNIDAILARDPKTLIEVAKGNCRIKGSVVEADTDESGLRRTLNFGHTPGHAIEAASGYRILHGEAVSTGMMVSGRIAARKGHLPAEDLHLIARPLVRAGLPITIPPDISTTDILEAMKVDKKGSEKGIRFSLASGIGTMCDFGGSYAIEVEPEIIRWALDETR